MMSWQTAPYDEYKDTEYDWLGRVPSHWEKTSIRSISKLSNQRYGKRDDLELLSVYREYGVIRKASRDDNHNVESEDLSNYKYVDKGYLVLNKMKMWQGSLGVSNYEGIVSPAYIVCQLSQGLNKHYVNYLLRAAVFKTIYNRLSYGVRVGQWDMRYEDFKNIILYIPPKEEQDQIVRYLDDKVSRINRFIRAKKKQIELLKEQKEAIIYHAVTKGLDVNVKMVPSGIEWVDETPENWGKEKITRLFRTIGSGTTPTSGNSGYYNGDIWWINSGDLNDGYISETKRAVTESALKTYSVLKLYPANTIAIAMYGATIGKLSITQMEACSNQACCCLGDIRERMHLKYAFYSLLSCRRFLIEQGRGGGQPNISQDIIKKTWFPVPPIAHQHEIVKYLEEETHVIDKAIQKFEEEIELITEYRTAIVSQVVTGKVDVRGIEIGDPVHFEEDLDELDEGELENLEIEEVGEEE